MNDSKLEHLDESLEIAESKSALSIRRKVNLGSTKDVLPSFVTKYGTETPEVDSAIASIRLRTKRRTRYDMASTP